MSHFVTQIPDVIVKPGKMIGIPISRMKLVMVVLFLVLYCYFLMFLKTFYLKGQRLDRIMAMALESEKRMLKVHGMDEKLGMQLDKFDLSEDY